MDFLQKELDQINSLGLYRSPRIISTPQEPEIIVKGKKMLLLASNNYLGLANHFRLKEKAIEVINYWGTGTGASRLVSGSTDIHRQLERQLASFKEQEEAIIFNTGYMANVGVISSLMGPEDIIYSDELNHASIIDGIRLSKATVRIFKHSDLANLETLLREESLNSIKGKRLIVTDGVFSMDGDLALLPDLVRLKKEYNCLLMIDDAHGTGVLGEKGKGTAEYFQIENGIDIHLGTLSKALGTEGGYVTGSRPLIEYLYNKARPFIFSTAIAPGSIGAGLAALEVLGDEPWRISELHKNAEYLRKGLRDIGLEVPQGITPIIPVVIGSNEETLSFSHSLEELGILAPAIRPPTVPEGTGRIRVTVMATHTKEHLDKAIEVFKIVSKKLGLSKV